MLWYSGPMVDDACTCTNLSAMLFCMHFDGNMCSAIFLTSVWYTGSPAFPLLPSLPSFRALQFVAKLWSNINRKSNLTPAWITTYNHIQHDGNKITKICYTHTHQVMHRSHTCILYYRQPGTYRPTRNTSGTTTHTSTYIIHQHDHTYNITLHSIPWRHIQSRK